MFVVVGRHNFTDVQRDLLERVGLKKEVYRFQTVENVANVVVKAKELGVNVIVVQGLPVPLLIDLVQRAKKEGVNVYVFKTEAVGIFEDMEQAKQHGDVIIPSREGGFRVLKTVALQRVLRAEIVVEDVVSLE